MFRFTALLLVLPLLGAVTSACGGPASTASTAPAATTSNSPAVTPGGASSAALLARGTFMLYGGTIEIHATRSGENVAGTMTVSHEDGDFEVELECARATADGVLLIAGDITESASPHAREGAREVLVLKPGSPVYASLDSEGRPGGDVRPAASCPELLQQVIDTGTQTVVGDNGLTPIEGGTVEFGP